MKKIMFNDKFGLTQAVLDGRKTQTRRVVTASTIAVAKRDSEILGGDIKDRMLEYSPYLVGEVIAIAQKYSELEYGVDWVRKLINKEHAGWNNKMFVSGDEMPHHIRITNIRVERLQDISDEDCLAEGVYYHTEPPKHHEYDRYSPWSPSVKPYKFESEKYFCSAKYAFKHLINKVSGKCTWESNPYVLAYDFEKVD